MNSKALIYKVQDYKESSKLLFVYTPHGKYTLVANGVKNYKNANFHLADYFNLIELELNPNRSMQALKKATLIDDYSNVKKDYNDFKISSLILKSIDRLIYNVEHEDKLFNLFVNLLNYKNKKLSYVTMLIKLTYSLGYRLSFTNKEFKGFSLKLGRTIKKDENIVIDLNYEETLYLKILYYTKEEIEIDDDIVNKLFNFIKRYYKYHIDYQIDEI